MINNQSSASASTGDDSEQVDSTKVLLLHRSRCDAGASTGDDSNERESCHNNCTSQCAHET